MKLKNTGIAATAWIAFAGAAVALCATSIGGILTAYAEPLTISLDSEVYNYGDRLVMTIWVEDVVGSDATIFIRDSSGESGSPIPISILDNYTEMPPSLPLERNLFAEGLYRVDIIYGNLNATTTFRVVDIGNVVVPFWIKQVAYSWLSGEIPDHVYVDALKNLLDLGILHSGTGDADAFVPAWIMPATAWWLQELVDDDAYVLMMQYMIDYGLVRGI